MEAGVIVKNEEANQDSIHLFSKDGRWYAFERSAYYLSILLHSDKYPVCLTENMLYIVVEEPIINWLYNRFSIDPCQSDQKEVILYMDFYLFFSKYPQWKTKQLSYLFNI